MAAVSLRVWTSEGRLHSELKWWRAVFGEALSARNRESKAIVLKREGGAECVLLLCTGEYTFFWVDGFKGCVRTGNVLEQHSGNVFKFGSMLL